MATGGQQAAKQAATNASSEFQELLDREAAVRPELLQMRMENETIMAECRAMPRSLAACKAKLDDLLTNFPEFAEDAVYRRPVGSDDGGSQKIAEGLSIRAAEALAEAYGYNRVRADVTRVDANHCKIDATFTDFATGRIWQEGRLVSQIGTRSKSKGGGQYRIDEQRFADTVVGAAKSKAIREVILRSVSPALKAWFTARCAEIVGELLTDAKVAEIIGRFAQRGVSAEVVEKLVGRPRNMGWTNEDKIALTGFFAALKNGETTVEQLLDAVGEGLKTQAPPPVSPKVTMDDLTGVKQSPAKTTPEAPATQPAQPAAKAEPQAQQSTPRTQAKRPAAKAETPAAKPATQPPAKPAAKPVPPPAPEPEPEPQIPPVVTAYDTWRGKIESASTEDEARAALSDASGDENVTGDEWDDLSNLVATRWDVGGDPDEIPFG